MQSRYDDRTLERIGARIAVDVGNGFSEKNCRHFEGMIYSVMNARRLTAPRPFVIRRIAVPVAAAVLTVIGVVLGVMAHRDRTMPFWLDASGHEGIIGAPIAAPLNDTTILRFPSKSEIVLRNGAQARMVAATEKAVRVNLEQGDIHANINGNGVTTWSIDAGPYTVEVVGTSFSVSWDRYAKHLDVDVQKGTVRVHGTALSDGGLKVTRGNQLQIDGETGLVALSRTGSDVKELLAHNAHRPTSANSKASRDSTSVEMDDNEGSSALASTNSAHDIYTESSTPAAEQEIAGATHLNGDEREKGGLPAKMASVERARKKRHRSVNAKQTSNRWRQLLSNGDFETLVIEAKTADVDQLIAKSELDDVWKLMHTARRLGRDDISIQLLLGIRSRYPESAKAGLAPVFLGKIYDEKKDNPSEALRWFSVYLNERPNGSLSEEAEGWIMMLHRRAGRREKARAAARHYLTKYTDGTFETVALSILDD